MRRLLCFFFLSVCVASAQQIAFDSAQNYPTTSGGGVWNSGDNFGFGFQPWQFVVLGPSGGMFLGNSTQNGGDASGNPGSSGGINSPNLRAWGAFANSNSQAIARRDFNSPLAIGQIFSVDFDNGFIDANKSEGIQLINSGGSPLWSFGFTGGDTNYATTDAGHAINTNLPFTDGGMHIAFTLTSPSAYTVTITLNSGASQTLSATLPALGAIAGFELVNSNGGFNSSNNAYANNLSIVVPEPGTLGLLGIGVVMAAILLRKQR